MAFPSTVLGIKIEFLIAGVWTNITSDVQGNTFRMDIQRGQYNESPIQTAGQCTFTIKNTNNKYSTRIPGTTYYGVLKRNIRVRVSITDPTLTNVYRFHGEIPKWPLRADSSGRYRFIPITARGILSRLSQGQKALRSPAYRTLTTSSSRTNTILYVPLEEESGATSFETVPSGSLVTTTDSLSIGGHTSHPASQRMITINAAGTIAIKAPTHTSTGEYKFVATWNIPTSVADGARIYRHQFSGGTLGFMEVWVRDNTAGTPESVTVWMYTTGNLAFDAPALACSGVLWGGEVTISLEFTQNGADINLVILVVGQDNTALSSTLVVSGLTMGTWTSTLISPRDFNGDFPTNGVGADACSVGHFIVGNDTTAFADFISPNADNVVATRAFKGEHAAARMQRLFAEEGVEFTLIGNSSDTERMGAQQVATLLDLAQSCAVADRGLLYETRDAFSLTYRTRRSLYNSAPTTVFRYATPYNHFGPEAMDSDDDDQFIWNDVTVSRVGGSQARRVQTSGPLNVNSPDDDPDGVNTYDRGSVNAILYTDAQCGQIASWIRHLGTTDELRYPVIPIHFGRAPYVTAAGAAALTLAAGELDIGVAMTIDSMPAHLPPESTRQQIRGYRETMTNKEWYIEFNAIPDWPYEVWVVDTGGSTIANTQTTSSTSWRLATSLGPAWSTTREPYYVQGGGEAVKVTAMATETVTAGALGTVSTGNNGASVTPGIPASLNPGDAMFMFVAIRSSGTGTPNTAIGWTALLVSGNVGIYGRYFQTGDAAPTVSFTGGAAGDDTYGRIWGAPGASLEFAGGTKLVPAGAAQLNGSATNVAYPGLSVVRAGALVMYFMWRQDDATSVATLAGATELFDTALTTGNDMHVAADYVIQTSAADIPSGSFTVTTGGGAAISRGLVLAVRPLQAATVTRNQNNTNVAVGAGSTIKVWRQGVNGL